MLSLRAVLPRYRPSLEQVMIIPHYRGLFYVPINSLRFMAVYNKLEENGGRMYGEKTGRQEFGRIVAALSHLSCTL